MSLSQKVTAWIVTLVALCSISFFFLPDAHASGSYAVEGIVYSCGENDHYNYSQASEHQLATEDNTYGQFTIAGDITPDGEKNGVPSYVVNGGNVSLFYAYTDALRDAPMEEWHLFSDYSKEIAGVKLDSEIKKGAIVVQSSLDGVKWYKDVALTDFFADTQEIVKPFFETKNIQQVNGCYYRVIVAYRTKIKLGQEQILFLKTDQFDQKNTVEVYEFYLHDAVQNTKNYNTQTRALGSLVRVAKEDAGYSGSKNIGFEDPQYNWKLGQFFVSGYTRATKDDAGNPVFLKTVGDKITLWFNLLEDIDRLHGNDALSIADDDKGYDEYFQTDKFDMGRGTLIIRYTDEKGIKHEPEIYTDYLAANATTSADTVVRLFEEGDYEVALDYKIKSAPRKLAGIEVIPTYSDYRISFAFSVRNGNCMFFPFDITTEQELTDESITPNGLKLDMAKSRYLTIDVKYARVTPGANGYVEDVRFNRPAKDGDSFTEEGIYTFSVNNPYTGEKTTKRFYVGDTDYLKALSLNNLSVSELNDRVAAGALIKSNGAIVIPTPTPIPTVEPTPVPTESPVPSVTPTAEIEIIEKALPQPQENDPQSTSGNVIPIAVIAGIVATAAILFVISKKKNSAK